QLLPEPELIAFAVIKEHGVAERQVLFVVLANLRFLPFEHGQDDFEALVVEVVAQGRGRPLVTAIGNQVDPLQVVGAVGAGRGYGPAAVRSIASSFWITTVDCVAPSGTRP